MKALHMLSSDTEVFVVLAVLMLSTNSSKCWCKQRKYEASVLSYNRSACPLGLNSFSPQALCLVVMIRAEYSYSTNK